MIPSILLTNRPFARLWAATSLSMFGNQLTFLALPIVAFEKTGSAATFASVMAASSAGILLTMLIGGALADRMDRRWLMLTGDACLVPIVLCLGACVHYGAWSLVMACAFVQTVVASLFRAGDALQRDLVDDGERNGATALRQFSLQTSSFIAPLLGAGLYTKVGFDVIVAIDIATYIASFLLMLGVADPAQRTARRERWGEVAANLVTEIRDGFALSARDGYLRGTLALTLFSGAANGLFFVSMVPWVTETLGQPAAVYGAIISLVGATGIIAAAVLARIGDRFAPEHLALVGIGLTVIGSLAFFGTTDLRLIGVCLACFGVSNVVSGIGFSAIQQRRYPSDVQGRIGSLQMVATQATSLLAVTLAGALGSTVDPAMLVAVFGGGLLLGDVCALLALRSVWRSPDAAVVIADVDIATRLAQTRSLSASGSLHRRSSARGRAPHP